ncbi:DHA2 family efflux MFS transporter permease subunit [Streptomyces sp. NPDC049954]|uniref:DHA2 family efflux MFS transporter permease subunit n=1 Tax=Streptomyces sp. NPDC049954 TaxID=3155779 RepID=UPI00341B0F9F
MRARRVNPWAVLVTLSLGFFMTLLDLTIVNIAIPDLMAGLGASLGQTLWVVSAYALTLSALIVTAGRLGDLWGPRNLFAAGLAVFTLGSLACGLAPTAAALIGARIVQGLGAALLTPQTTTLIVAVFPAERRGTAMGVWGSVAGLATLCGPTLGGFLVSAAGWRWVFLVNLPVGAAALVLTFLVVPDLRPGRARRLDLPGVLLVTAALFCLAFGLQEGGGHHWNAGILTLLGAGAVLAVAFVLHQRRRQDREPLVPFALFRERNFTAMTALVGLFSVAMLGLVLPFNLYLQSVAHLGAAQAGLVLAPSSLVSLALGPFAGRLADRVGGTYVLLTGLLCYASGVVTLALLARPGSTWPDFLPGTLLTGVGVGCVLAPMSAEAMRYVPRHLAGAASGVNGTVRQIGSVVGAAAVSALLQSGLASGLAHGESYADAFTATLHTTARLSVAVLTVGALACLLLRPHRRPDRVRTATKAAERAAAADGAASVPPATGR